MQNLYAIPVELRLLPNWILWKFEYPNGRDKKPTKRPYQISGDLASVTNPNHWVTFDAAFNALQFGGYDGLGFVFTNTEYSGIDLDDCSTLLDGSVNPNRSVDLDRQIKVFNEFDSYSERSPSGNGLHVIVKGSVPTGKKKSFIELYSTGRYFTMTGNVYADKPIVNRQDLLTQLWEQMGGHDKPILSQMKDEAQSKSDEEIINAASNAVNGDKFLELYKGDWKKVYPEIANAGNGPSEADQALVNIISFYSRNKVQIARIFLSSVLGKRDKVLKRKDYLNTMIDKSFDNAPMMIDFQNYAANIEEQLNNKQLSLNLDAGSVNGKPTPFDGVTVSSNLTPATNGPVAQRLEPSPHKRSDVGSNPTGTTNITLPPGLVGEIAQFIYEAAPRQVKEIALGAALGLMAGTCGRAYNINGTGLNLYILILAKTGRGKEAAASGIDKLMNEVTKSVPTATRFRGPGIINSGQALIKHVADTSNSFISVLGEFGLTIDRISNAGANSADKMLYQMLLDLYNKSGHGQTLQASIYSNKEDSVGATRSPAVTILGESTHKLFYGCLTEDMISAGLLPRFLIIEYNGERVLLNEKSSTAFPDFTLVQRFSEIVAYSETIQHNQKVVNVRLTDEASKMLRDFDHTSTNRINQSENDVVAELWNRAHMKIMRVASLIAVGVNPYDPLVTLDNVLWAQNLVEHDIKALSIKFESGLVGKSSEEAKQFSEFKRAVLKYLKEDWESVKSYCEHEHLHTQRVIPFSYLNKKLRLLAPFKNDRQGGTAAIQRTIRTMAESGYIEEISKPQMVERYKCAARAFIIPNMSVLDLID